MCPHTRSSTTWGVTHPSTNNTECCLTSDRFSSTFTLSQPVSSKAKGRTMTDELTTGIGRHSVRPPQGARSPYILSRWPTILRLAWSDRESTRDILGLSSNRNLGQPEATALQCSAVGMNTREWGSTGLQVLKIGYGIGQALSLGYVAIQQSQIQCSACSHARTIAGGHPSKY